MDKAAITMIESFGWIGVLVVLLSAIAYLIWKEQNTQKQNTANREDFKAALKQEMGVMNYNLESVVSCLDSRIESVSTKVDVLKQASEERKKILLDNIHNIDKKIDKNEEETVRIEGKIDNINRVMTKKISSVETQMHHYHAHDNEIHNIEAREQANRIFKKDKGGQLSCCLRKYCKEMSADHVFLAQFHNGTVDLRGIHFVKFDIITDEFADPLHLAEGDMEFAPLYKDQYVVSFGNTGSVLCRVPSLILDVDGSELIEQSDTLYRRCKARGIEQIGLAIIRDHDGDPIGFVGATNHSKDKKLQSEVLEKLATEIQNIYNTTDYD
jgi:hypothetical protein